MRTNPLATSLFFIWYLITITNTFAQSVILDGRGTGRELPPGVARTVDTNGNTVYIKSHFTSKAYQVEALHFLVLEANRVAAELQLPEALPITETNLVEFFVSPFGYGYRNNAIGNVTTQHYMYGVEEGNKFSDLVIANYDRTCLNYEAQRVSIRLIDTNMAYQMATQWLKRLSIDVGALNRDCQVVSEVSRMWNGLQRGAKITGTRFAPIYDVGWFSPKDRKEGGDTAYVEMFAPSQTILQLVVRDAKYISRPPVVFTNLSSLFPGIAPIYTNYPYTNYPLKTIIPEAP